MTATDLERTIARIDREIKQAFPEVKRIFIEAEAPHSGPTSHSWSMSNGARVYPPESEVPVACF